MAEEKDIHGKEAKSTFLDMNASWPLMFVYLGYIIGMFYTQSATFGYLPSGYNTYVYTFMALIFGVLITFLVYNAGKILFASIAGYRVFAVKILGFSIDKSAAGKSKVSFSITAIFDVSLQFAPKNDDVKKNPRLIFIGGYLFELLLIGVALALFFVLAFPESGTMKSVIGWSALFALIYGLIIPIYEIIPFRQDYPTDMYNLMVTKEKEDQEAYNLVHINRRRELSGEDFLAPSFQDYDSYYKAQTLYALYLTDLYQDDLAGALDVLDLMKYYRKKLPEEDRYLAVAESVYLRYLADDENGANQLFVKLGKEEKKSIVSPTLLSNYRTSLLILGYITEDRESLKEEIRNYQKATQDIKEPSARVKKEEALFLQAYDKLRTGKPELGLQELN
jgi:hypothetical protein